MSQERIAAAVILCRGSGPDLEVYLAHRAPELRFFGNYLACPGGVRGPEDGPDDADGSDGTALRNCAVRELFEETGVLLDPGMARTAAAERKALRETLLGDDRDAGAQAWGTLQDRATAAPPLREICRIRTPPFAPVRYDTVFYLAHLPAGEKPEIWPGELVGGSFLKPADALDQWRRGERLIVPPVLVLLERMIDGDLDGFASSAAAMAEGFRRGKLHRIWFSPGVLLAPLTTPTLPPATTTNCYIVGKERLFVIDPGTPEADEQARLFELLDELQAEGATLDSVVCTHHHPDHVGGVLAVSQRYQVPVRAHRITLDRLDERLHATLELADGDELDLGRAPDGSEDWKLRAIFTPGHDRGHLVFQESRYRALIAGDMISTVATIMIDPPEGHMQTYLDSLQKLAETPMTTLYPAHGPAVPDGKKIVTRFIKHRQQRVATLKSVLNEQPGSVEDLLPKVYWDVKEAMYPYAARSMLASLEMLVEAGEARESDGVWQLVAK